MEYFQLLENLDFREGGEHAEARAVYADDESRTLRFALIKGQKVKPHLAHSPVHVVVLKGEGVFTGRDGKEQSAGPNSMLIFGRGEEHSVRAVSDELVFVAVLHGAPGASHEPVGSG